MNCLKTINRLKYISNIDKNTNEKYKNYVELYMEEKV